MRDGRSREVRALWSAKPTIDPVEEPLTIEEAKLHCAISQEDDNALVEAFIRAAREACEALLGRGFFTQTRVVQYSEFADVLWLPFAAPLQNDPDADPSTAPVITYYDTDGALQTLATSFYVVNQTCEPGRIERAPGQSWPAVEPDRAMPVTITYVCGWADVNAIPEPIKLGMRLHIAASDADRVNPSYTAAEAVWERVGRVYWREPETCLV